jgi:putative transposase
VYPDGVSRAGFYRRGVSPRCASVELRDQVQRVRLEWPSYGSRRITAELRRGGLSVNRKRGQRLMRENNLMCLRKRKFVATTDSAHGMKVYPNLAAALVVSGINQLWRADITYIRLLQEFVYLAVVRDAFSRRAFARRRPAPGLVHHSDQGVQAVPGLGHLQLQLPAFSWVHRCRPLVAFIPHVQEIGVACGRNVTAAFVNGAI